MFVCLFFRWEWNLFIIPETIFRLTILASLLFSSPVNTMVSMHYPFQFQTICITFSILDHLSSIEKTQGDVSKFVRLWNIINPFSMGLTPTQTLQGFPWRMMSVWKVCGQVRGHTWCSTIWRIPCLPWICSQLPYLLLEVAQSLRRLDCAWS